ncbi:6925_t:CDS:2, partial [Paraglomus brasilianum]
SRFMDLSPSRSSSVWGSAIKKHPLYLTLENYDFLDELTPDETHTIEAKYAHLNKTPPNRKNDWDDEIKDVHPWVQTVYESLARIWNLAIIQDKHSGGRSGTNYADHYLTNPSSKDLYTKHNKTIDWTRCYAFEDKLKLSEYTLNEAMVQCHRYCKNFFGASENRERKYVSIITDGSNYALCIKWEKKETLLIVGRVFKTFAQANIGRLRASASPQELESFFPDKDIANVDSPNTTSTSFTHRHLNINKGLYNVILQWAAKRSQFGLPIVSTGIGEVEAYRILGTGSSSVVFEAYTPDNVRVALKYSLDDRCLEREVQ